MGSPSMLSSHASSYAFSPTQVGLHNFSWSLLPLSVAGGKAWCVHRVPLGWCRTSVSTAGSSQCYLIRWSQELSRNQLGQVRLVVILASLSLVPVEGLPHLRS